MLMCMKVGIAELGYITFSILFINSLTTFAYHQQRPAHHTRCHVTSQRQANRVLTHSQRSQPSRSRSILAVCFAFSDHSHHTSMHLCYNLLRECDHRQILTSLAELWPTMSHI